MEKGKKRKDWKGFALFYGQALKVEGKLKIALAVVPVCLQAMGTRSRNSQVRNQSSSKGEETGIEAAHATEITWEGQCMNSRAQGATKPVLSVPRY